MAFDIYFHKGKDVSNKPLLVNSKNRMSILQDIIENKENKFIPENKSNNISINLKKNFTLVMVINYLRNIVRKF